MYRGSTLYTLCFQYMLKYFFVLVNSMFLPKLKILTYQGGD